MSFHVLLLGATGRPPNVACHAPCRSSLWPSGAACIRGSRRHGIRPSFLEGRSRQENTSYLPAQASLPGWAFPCAIAFDYELEGPIPFPLGAPKTPITAKNQSARREPGTREWVRQTPPHRVAQCRHYPCQSAWGPNRGIGPPPFMGSDYLGLPPTRY